MKATLWCHVHVSRSVHHHQHHPVLGRSTVFTSIWGKEDMKATLWCHAHVNRSVHHHQHYPSTRKIYCTHLNKENA